MLLPWEIKCNITRAPTRSVLIACVSALIACGMALYLRNIGVTEETLDDLAQQMPVTVRVTNRDGYLHEGLLIPAKDVDYLLESGVRDPVYTAAEFTAEPIGSIYGTNTLDSLDGLGGPDLTFADGWDESFPMSRKPVVALREDIARENDWGLGDRLRLEFSMLDRRQDAAKMAGSYYVSLIAVYPEAPDTPGAVMPVDWLRGIADVAFLGGAFRYDSFCAVMKEPRELNAYKDAAEEWGFYERSAVADPAFEGDTLSVEDEMYIKTAGELTETLYLYRAFLPPFFVLAALMITMAAFLALRSCRRQIAVLCSLGRQRSRCAAAHFLSTAAVQLMGSIPALLALTLGLGLSPALLGMALGAFSLCALGGTALALWFLFRFDTLTLLTKVE